jgi:methylated-DNA-[protein]-cysteine S-methyltransferase
VPVDLEHETDFLGRCARALREIPRGEVVTYGELAALAGAPGAARAAGTFCARNRLGLFVPCHRVVGAGGIGSYGSYGIEYKRRLLELEGAAVS